MTVIIRVLNVRHTFPHRGPMLQARCYSASGQLMIEGAIRDGHDPTTQCCAVAEIANWIRVNRPGWNIQTNSPTVEFTEIA